MTCFPKALVLLSVLACIVVLSAGSLAQASHSEQVQIMPPLMRTIDPPSPDASASELEARGDQLRVVAEGESSNETIIRQLSDMLGGLLILAQAGLDDPKARKQLDPDLREAYRIESSISSEVFTSEDAKEGPKAFAEKRAPNWKNR